MSDTIDNVLTVGDLAKKVKRSPYQVRRMIEEGRIPYASKVGNSWIVETRSLEFLLDWIGKIKYRGRAGQFAAQAMREAAGKLDPECRSRYSAWQQLHPHGWATEKKPAKAKRRRAAK